MKKTAAKLGGNMRWIASGVGILAGVMGLAAEAVEVAGNRGLSPIICTQAGTTANTTPQPDYILNKCQEIEPTGDPQSALRAISPSAALRGYFEDRDNKLLDLALFKPSLLQGAKHGKITEGVDKDNLGFTYDPDVGYLGDDQAIFMVEFEGKRYKVIYQIKVMEYIPDDTTCTPPTLDKVTKPSSGDSGFGAGYTLGSVGVSFADLLGAAVGPNNR